MEVIGTCGHKLGTVDRIEGNSIKLAKNDPKANGMHHWIPIAWVESVDDAVRLSKDCEEAMKMWRPDRSGVTG